MPASSFRSWQRVEFAESDVAVPSERSGASAVLLDDSLFLLAGYSGQGRLEDIHRLDLVSRQWHRVTVRGEERPAARENNSAVLYGDRKFLLFGGYSGAAWLDDFWEFTVDECLDSGVWSRVSVASSSGPGPCSRFGFVTGILEDKLYLGFGYTGSQWLGDMHAFDLKRREWKAVEGAGGSLSSVCPSRRSCPSWSVYGGSFWLFAGFNGVDRLNDFWQFDGERWSLVKNTGGGNVPCPRYFHSSVVFGDCLYICAGYSGTDRLNDLHEYNFRTLTWTEILCAPSPDFPGRSSLIAVVYRRWLLAGFGYNGQQVLNDMYQYELDPIEIPPSTLAADIYKLVQDVEFHVPDADNVVRANKAWLAARSPHFRAMLFDFKAETDQRQEIKIDGVDRKVFEDMLEYIYADRLSSRVDSDYEALVQLLIVADRYLMSRLKSMCEDRLRHLLNINNAVNTLLCAHTYNAQGLLTICLEFIITNEEHIKQVNPQSLKLLINEPQLIYLILLKRSSNLD